MATKKKAPEAEVAEEVQATAPAEAQPQAPNLDLKDLAMCLQLVEAAIQRGAYQPQELVSVGETYGRIQAFLQYQAQMQQAAQAQGEQ